MSAPLPLNRSDQEIIVSTGPAAWLRPNFVEPRVQLALNDLCKGGGVAFDVGANFGFLSVAMSRRVGPRGAVCAFEANPNIAQLCQSLLIESGCGNAQVYNNAVYSKSREIIKLYLSENMVADSIHRHVSEKTIDIATICLDDFVEDVGLTPDIIKMDIEGAELDALLGFERTLSRYRPTMILEQSPDDSRCLELMKSMGYTAIDLGAYRRLEMMGDMPPSTPVTDVLFIMPDLLAQTPYRDLSVKEYGTVPLTDFAVSDGVLRSAPRHLPTGRYIAHATFEAEGDQAMMCGVEIDGQEALRCHGSSKLLVHFASKWPFNALGGRSVSFYFKFDSEPDPSFALKSFSLQQMPSFDGLSPLF